MSDPSSKTETTGEKPWPVIIMISMIAVVILAGYILAPSTDEEKLNWLELLGTTNHGIFMNPPVTVPEGQFILNNQPWERMEQPTWKLVVVNEGLCDQSCQEMIFLVRQVHTRLNREASRVDLGFANGGESGIDLVEMQENYAEVALLETGNFGELIAASNLADYTADPVIILINPVDVIQMFYTDQHDGNGILEDVNHLHDLAH